MTVEPLNYLKDCTSINYFNEQSNINTSFSLTKLISKQLKFKQIGGTINDASCLNRTSILGVVDIKDDVDIKEALILARENNLKISIGGEKHSMGGQTFCKNCLLLDTRNFRKILSLDSENQTITVQPGIKRVDIQNAIDPYGLSVSAMQSINMFTVGGSISVNAHGISHNPGPIGSTILAIKVMLSSGEIIETSPQKNAELFSSIIGGYGLYGIMTEVKLKLVPNELYNLKRTYMNVDAFSNYYYKNLKNNSKLGLLYGRISVAPFSGFSEMYINEFTKIMNSQGVVGLKDQKNILLMRFIINLSKQGGLGKIIRRTLEKYIEPKLKNCNEEKRNVLMSKNEDCIIVRNQEMDDNMYYLKNKLNDTDILQEYFVPIEMMSLFVKNLEYIVYKNNNNLLNITMRFGNKDTVSKLPYLKDDNMVALVLYFNHDLTSKQMSALELTTKELIDVAVSMNGSYYLPYQLYYTKKQLISAYPNIINFFEKKKLYDPSDILVNKFYLKYK